MDKINIIDIGALDGLDYPWKRHKGLIDKILRFEPNEEIKTSGDTITYNCAIWDENKQAPFFISGANGSGSSLLRQNHVWVNENFNNLKDHGDLKLNQSWSERSKITHETTIEVKTLDTVLADLEKHQPNLKFQFLKSDTQSGEGYIIKGAKNFLSSTCIGIELELFRYPLYKNIILDVEVISMLSGLGFEKVGQTEYKNSFLSQYDALFIKTKGLSKSENELIKAILSIYKPDKNSGIIRKKSFRDKLFSKINSMINR